MQLFVMRHGPAEDRAASGRDEDRALTVAGRAVVARAVRMLGELREPGGRPCRVVSSPLVRARETAALVRAVIDVQAIGWPALEVHASLAENQLPLPLVRHLVEGGVDAVIVGHQPVLEELVEDLVQPSLALLRAAGAASARPLLRGGFRPATIVVLEPSAHPSWGLTSVIDPYASGS